ncbi:hypothetical protein [Undibacterium sp. TS12]|uniref:hypothetical protein n=1 Tax=Undibacterium sp. TS12 TaxID=2908202 RepID=UPI001F4C7048|nr:hypothetical protein [Undibacterium sp. TS12]MCH8622647.1 hypothetical protein [Undibacterium sp. TS12]
MMTTIEQRISEGSRAREVLENEAYQQAFSAIESEITEKWKNSPARDAEGREKLWMYLAMLKKFKNQLDTTLETGKLAQLDLEHRQSLMHRLKSW